jgi:Tfp pilus assembly protein PilN
MIKINLLAAEAIKKEERSEILLIGYLIIAVLFLYGGSKYVIKRVSLLQINSRAVIVQQELTRYEDIVRQVESLESTKKVLETKKNVMSSLMTTRLIYPKFMQDILTILPKNIWLKSISTQIDATAKMTVTMSASALDNYSIADFVGELISNGDYGDVNLGAISAQGGKVPSSAFQVSFSYLKKTQEAKK